MTRRLLPIVLLLTTITPCIAQPKPYNAGEIFSKQTYKHAKVEMRMRTARHSGTLSTFFTYKDRSEQPDVQWEEIDIEIFGKDDARTWQSNVITGKPRTGVEAEHTPGYSFADDFHVFTLEWTPEYVAWSVDGKEVRRITGGKVNELVNEQSLRFNLWPTSGANWAGKIDDSALPVYQHVDWIKVYRYKEGKFVHEWTDDFDHFDDNRWGKADWTFDVNMANFAPENVTTKDGHLILAITRKDQSPTFKAPN